MPEAPAASVSVDRICQVFNFEWATSEPVDGLDTYWWWCRDVRLDPDEVIAADGEGGTWRVPFTTDGDYVVTFGDPVQVRETYVDVAAPAAAASAATARVHQRVAARGLERPTKPDPTNPAASAATTEEDDRVTIDIPALRSRLQLSEEQLPDDATEDQINAALAETPEPSPEPEQPQPDQLTPEPQPEPAPAAASADTVTVSRQVWEQTTQRLDALEASARERTEAETRQRRDGLASAWVQDGRIAPSERDHYRQLLDVDEDRTVGLAATLQPGRIPVDERGSARTTTSGNGDDDTLASLDHLFPQLAAQEA
jgi:hypothetical protein